MDAQVAELVEDVRARSMTYSFLARALSDEEVGADFLAGMAAEDLGSATELDAYAQGLCGMTPEELEAQRRELAADHASCLLGMAPDPVSPYESVYRSDRHLMMQSARDEVVAAYARAGFAKSDDYHMPEDHVSLELDFLAGLTARLADALARASAEGALDGDAEAAAGEAQDALDAQVDFLKGHALLWMPAFARDLEEHAASPFYRGVAQMLRAFLADEQAYLEELEGASA